MKPFSFMNERDPINPDIPDLDETTQQVIRDRTNNALTLGGQTDEQAGQKFVSEIADNPFAQSKLTGDAIRNKAFKKYESDINKIKTQKELGNTPYAFQRLQDAASLQQKKLQYRLQRLNAVKQRNADAQAQRASILGSLLSIGGAAAGAAVGGAPGAIIGQSAGQGAGTMVSQKGSK